MHEATWVGDPRPPIGGIRRWVRWYGRSMRLLGACLLGGLSFLLVLALLGLDPEEAGPGAYAGLFAVVNLLVPFTAAAYLFLLALLARVGRWPRVWAFLLTPVFWFYLPYLALLPWFPPTGAMWLSLLVFARTVEMPPYRTRTTADPVLFAPERPA